MSHPTIYFIRHGQTDWNAELRLQGQRDISLNAKGRAQAARNGRMLASLLGDPTRFHFTASPLARARETMEIVRAELGLVAAEYATEDCLKELSFGAWEGQSWPELIRDAPHAIEERAANTFDFAPPDGESYRQLSERVANWFDAIERDTVVVSHGGVSRVLRGYLLSLAEADITELKVPQDKIMRIRGPEVDWH
ncbi:MAG: histidine phosphatase family protein [Hyphomicrobiaceae bacterium]